MTLDSSHTHDHVPAELEVYAPLTSVGNYCVVFDAAVEDVSQAMFNDRPWDARNSPRTAVHAYLRDYPEFVTGADTHHKPLITVVLDDYLKHVA